MSLLVLFSEKSRLIVLDGSESEEEDVSIVEEADQVLDILLYQSVYQSISLKG